MRRASSSRDSTSCTFARVYYAAAALFLLALACLPVLVPLSFVLYGFDPGLRDSYTPESFEAYRVTAPFRRGFGYGVVVLAASVLLLTLATLIARRRLRLAIPRIVPVVVSLGAALAAVLMLTALMSASGICC